MSLNVELLEQSFEKIKPRADEFVASFYENLFAAYPEVQPLFATTDMAKQQKKLLNALVLVVESLRNPQVLGEVLNVLGARHVGYGAIADHYPAVGETLLMTFDQYLQQDWTPEVKQAWLDAFGAISDLMLKGAGEESPPQLVPEKPITSSEKPSELKADLSNEVNEFKPGDELKETPSVSLQWDATTLKEILRNMPEKIRQVRSLLLNQRWVDFLKQIPAKFVETFWILPVWIVATVSALAFTVVFLLAEENSLLAEILGGADTISLVVALVLFIKEAPDRRKQFHYQA